ncbi:MAG: hypothetical protein QG656_2560 [Candidatus Hydrogenedentes bacterium]|nr:hypothetical protein [Candidatus Hydrogenedentota bacterium]
MRMIGLLTMGLTVSAAMAPSYAEGAPLKVCMVSGSFEYDSDTSLTMFKEYLDAGYNVEVTLLKATSWTEIPGLEALDTCDVALFFTRRLEVAGDALKRIQDYCRSGRPIVACRTASHGFQSFLEFDKEILGGHYDGHFGEGPTTKTVIDAGAADHPILEGVIPMKSRYSLYRNEPLAYDCTLLMRGAIPSQDGPQPVAWTREVNGGRVFYTSLGGVGDFENNSFKRMMANALFWTACRDVDRKPLPAIEPRVKPEGMAKLKLRTWAKEGDAWIEKPVETEVPIAETAILICDMWDKHWCSFASERCEEIAIRMNGVVKAARDAGMLIIHSPSDTLGFYLDSPQRRRAQLALPVEPKDVKTVIDLPSPISSATNGGCPGDDVQYSAWTRQSPHIEIGPDDVISDDGREVNNVLAQEGIKNLIVMGVHTNMCVINRTFGIKQMTRWGLQCYLVRDLTDTMYNPVDPPQVPHDEGTELMVQHIEKLWAPSMLSEDLVQGLPK